MDHASLEELAKSYLRLRFDTAGAQRGKRKEKVGRGVSTRQTSSQNLGNVTAIESGKGPKLVFSAPLMVVPTHEQRTIGPAGTETALLDPNRVHHEYCRLMNSIISLFYIEGIGFGRGEGALDLSASRMRSDMHVLDPKHLSDEAVHAVKAAFHPLLSRYIMPIVDECEQPDRQHFDETVIRVYDLSVSRDHIYDCLKRLVAIRLAATEIHLGTQ